MLIRHDAALEATEVNSPNRPYVQLVDAETVRWRPPAMQPNQYLDLQVGFLPKAPVAQAVVAMNAQSNGATANASAMVRIIDPRGSVLPPGAGGAGQGNAGVGNPGPDVNLQVERALGRSP